MNFTDIFIRRPVLASVISLFILVLGVRAYYALPVLQYPRTENAVVTVTTTYYGADPDMVAGFITTPLEIAIAQAYGIDYMTSSSQSGTSTITIYLRLNYDADKALTEINTKIQSVLNQLPTGTQQPVLTVKVGQTIDAMYLGFDSEVLAPNQITDYLTRVVQPKLQTVPGVQTAELLGQKVFALRAWLDPQKLAAFGLTANDVSAALAANDFISGIGTTKGQMVQVNLTASTGLHTANEFRNLVIKQANGAVVRLQDVANVTLGAEDYESEVGFDGKQAVYIGIQVAPAANLLEVIRGVRKIWPDIHDQLPRGLDGAIVYDSTQFVNAAIYEVVLSLAEALAIVTLVVFMFLGSVRASLIPTVAIPLSLVGTLIILLALGYSINLLTLLALVLGIGLVVDDAIIVVENVSRHLEEGVPPIPAAIAAVTVSGVVALTLSPMLCSRLLKNPDPKHRGWESKFTSFIDRGFNWLRGAYERRLHRSLNYLPVTVVFALVVLGSIYFLFITAHTELAPQEDQGVILSQSIAAPNSTLRQRELYAHQVYEIFFSHPETEHVFQIDFPGQVISGMALKPWDKRSKSSNVLQPAVQQEVSKIAGIRVVAFQPPPLPGSIGLPVQFVIGTTESFERLYGIAQQFLREAQQSGNFIFLDCDLKIDNPQSNILIDRDKTAQLGLKMSDIGGALQSMLGGGYINYFSMTGRSYKVIPQVQQRFRLNAQQLLDYHIRTADGSLVPLSTVATVSTKTVPEALNHFQQLNSATIQGVAMPGVSQGDAITYLQNLAARTLPRDYSVDYGGLSRQYIQETSGFVTTFGFALIIVFLALAALFESFRDPVIILVSVPMSIAGALIFVSIGIAGASLNIYTEVGLVTLMGLISKHGILIVQFANDLQAEGRGKRDAIETAAGIRLRPILMTTAAMVLGVVPLITAGGAGAVSRFQMGLVIATGLTIGTLFTLFVVPAVYMLLATDRSKQLAGVAAAVHPAPAE